MSGDSAARRNLALSWLAIMSLQRFSFVTASLGFIKGELFRSPVQAQTMAAVLAEEHGLDDATARRFAKALSRSVGFGLRALPLAATFGAIKAMPFRRRWRSARHVLLGRAPRDAHERVVSQAVEDGVLQGTIYSSDDWQTMQARTRAELKALSEGRGPGVARRLGDAGRWVARHADLITTAIDLTNRIHVYEAALAAGLSRQKAAVMARESTVDFGKKGTTARGIGQFYLFFQPRMAGINQLIRAFAAGEGKTVARRAGVRAIWSIFAWNLMLGVLREMFYEDDEDVQTMTSKFSAEMNMLVPTYVAGDGRWTWLQINNPYGFGAAAKVGNAVADMLAGDSTPGQALAASMGAITDEMMPISVADKGRWASWVTAATPTTFQPFVEAIQNVDFKASPIAPLGPEFGAGEQRRSRQYFADTPLAYVVAAGLLADLTEPIARWMAGDGSRGLEISPNQIQHVLERWMPGVVRDAQRLYGVATAGEVPAVSDVPVLSTLVGTSGGTRVVPGRFRDVTAVYENYREDVKRLGRQDADRIHGPMGRWLDANWRAPLASLKKLQQARNAAVAAGDLERARRVEERMDKLRIDAVNRALSRMERER